MENNEESITISGTFHYTTDSLHNKNYFEDGLIARMTTFDNWDVATTIKFILLPGEKMYLGQKKPVRIKVLNYDFIKHNVENKEKLVILFSPNSILGEFFPE